jgi:hypothetical protein
VAALPRVIPSVVDVHFRWLGPDQQQCENVYQYRYSAAPSGAVCAALAAAVAAAMGPKYQAFMTTRHTLSEVFVKDIAALSGRGEGTYVFPSNTVGSRGEDPLPGNAAASMTLRTGLTGRSNHGRKSISGFSEPWVSADQMLSQLITWLADLGIQWLVTRIVSGVTFTPVVASNLRDTALNLTQVVLTDTVMDSQKTRLKKHGR